jgi:hypothetical protein
LELTMIEQWIILLGFPPLAYGFALFYARLIRLVFRSMRRGVETARRLNGPESLAPEGSHAE